jgi:hypothetical protein
MRFFRIRAARIPDEDRHLFERYGSAVIGFMVASGAAPRAEELRPVYFTPERTVSAVAWLTEQYDRAERKESWSILMEASITVFVLAEVAFSAISFIRGN